MPMNIELRPRVCELALLQNLLHGWKVLDGKGLTFYSDHKHNRQFHKPAFSGNTKHIKINRHFIKENVSGILNIY